LNKFIIRGKSGCDILLGESHRVCVYLYLIYIYIYAKEVNGYVATSHPRAEAVCRGRRKFRRRTVGCGVVEGGCSSICESGKRARPLHTSRAKTIDVHIRIIQSGGRRHTKSCRVFRRVRVADAEKLDGPPCICIPRTRTTISKYIFMLATTLVYTIRPPPPEWHRFSRTTTLYYVCNVMSIRCRYTRTVQRTPLGSSIRRQRRVIQPNTVVAGTYIIYPVRQDIYFPTETLTSDFIKT